MRVGRHVEAHVGAHTSARTSARCDAFESNIAADVLCARRRFGERVKGKHVESLRTPYKGRKISRVHNSGISRQYKQLSADLEA